MNKLNVIESQPLNRGNRVVVGVMDATVLAGRSSINIRDWQEQSGYQRRPNYNRVTRIARLLRNGPLDLTSSFLVGIRAPASEVLSEKNGGLYLDLNGHKAHVIDAQHRVVALQKVIDEYEGSLDDYKINVNFILDSSEVVEMEVFHETNTTAERIKPDLRYDLMLQRWGKDSAYRKAIKEERKEWIIQGQILVERLAKDSPHWQGRIQFPHEPIADTTIGNSGLVNSLRKLLTVEPGDGRFSPFELRSILKCFWSSVARALPECFLPGEATNYLLQRSTGAATMHTLLADLIERDAGEDSLLDPSFYAPVQDVLRNLTGENRLGEQVTGARFWLKGVEGVAAVHASNGTARRVLVDKIKAALGDCVAPDDDETI